MTSIVRCERYDCDCNEDGQCEQTFGVEIDENGECMSFEVKIEEDEKE